ncbi:MAG: response regulator [Campylobacterales bacterium]|nr:response regulator [Campylobacterales bacterium]
MNLNPSILIVDDSRMMRDIVTYALECAGYTTLTQAEDGIDALEKIEAHPFDLIITDINMPRMDGIELCKALQKNEKSASIPIVVLTTESSDEMKSKGKESGAWAWIIKPFLPDDLLHVVTTILGHR